MKVTADESWCNQATKPWAFTGFRSGLLQACCGEAARAAAAAATGRSPGWLGGRGGWSRRAAGAETEHATLKGRKEGDTPGDDSRWLGRPLLPPPERHTSELGSVWPRRQQRQEQRQEQRQAEWARQGGGGRSSSCSSGRAEPACGRIKGGGGGSSSGSGAFLPGRTGRRRRREFPGGGAAGGQGRAGRAGEVVVVCVWQGGGWVGGWGWG